MKAEDEDKVVELCKKRKTQCVILTELRKSMSALENEKANSYDTPALIISNNQGGGKHICNITDQSVVRMVITYAINEAENAIKAIDDELAKF
jgi:hypothetical protein